MRHTEDPTANWENLDRADIVEQLEALRARIEAIPKDVMEELLLTMDIGVYDRKGNLLGEKSFLIPGASRENKPYPFMFLSKLRNSDYNMFLKITEGPAYNDRYDVTIHLPAVLKSLGMGGYDGEITVQCDKILTRYDESNSEYTPMDFESLDLEYLIINCKLYTAIMDCYEEQIDEFLDVNIECDDLDEDEP